MELAALNVLYDDVDTCMCNTHTQNNVIESPVLPFLNIYPR